MKEEYKFVHHSLTRECDSLLHLLQKGSDFSHEKGGETESEILNAQLAPDMMNFTRQVQVFSDNIMGAVARLNGAEKPSMPDVEKSFTELIARVSSAKEFIQTFDPEKLEGLETRKIKLPWMQEGMYFDAVEYMSKFVLQNTFFHLVTAYGILRHKGVQIGKMDYIGTLNFKNQ